jgi:hypothetical protein
VLIDASFYCLSNIQLSNRVIFTLSAFNLGKIVQGLASS